MGGTESAAHRHLKQLALAWVRANGYRAGGLEIKIPSSSYRADVAGYKPSRNELGSTVILECKQARADFLRDAASAAESAAKLRRLHQRRLKLEELLKLHHPNLRRGETLFAEYDVFDFTALEHKTYARVIREIEVVQSRIYGKTKLDKVARYQCANLLYLVTESGIVGAHEIPLGWGWLERSADDEGLILKTRPTWQEAPERNRLKLLESIAVAGTRSFRQQQIGRDGVKRAL